MLDILLRR